MKFNLLLLFTIITVIHNGYSQEIHIINEIDLSPIENVAIFTPDMSTSALTNKDGNANINEFSNSEHIYFQHPSFKSKILSFSYLKELGFVLKLSERTIKISEIIVAANKWEQESSEIPNKIASISAKSIKFTNPQTTADLLSSTNEIFVQKSQMGGGSPMIRGFAANRLLIVVDGVRMNNSIFRSGNLQNVILIDPNALESSEVIFGPGTVIYGSDALGGVMDFHTKRIILSDNEKPLIKTTGMMRYSSANNEKTGNISINYAKKNWGFVSILSHSNFDDLRTGSNRNSKYPDWGKRPEYVTTVNNLDSIVSNPNENIQKFSAYSQTNFLQKFIYKPNNKVSLQYSFIHSSSSDIPRYDRLLEYDNEVLKYAVWEYGPQKWNMHNLQFASFKGTKYFDKMSFGLSYQDIEESRIDRKTYSSELRTRTEEVDAVTFSIDLEKDISDKQALYYGFEGLYNYVNSSGISEDIISGNISPTSSRYPDGGTDYYSSALYLSYKSKINQKLIFQSGLRYNYTYLKSTFNTNIAPLSISDININTGSFNGSAGLVFSPQNNFRITTNLSSGYRVPNLDDIAKIFDSEPGNVIIPNENLNPEYAYNIDLGITKFFGTVAAFNMTVFYTYLDNAMVRRDTEINGLDSIFYDGELSKVQSIVNTGYASIFGGSAEIVIDISNHISLKSTLTFTDGFDDEELPLRHTPPLFGNTTITYKTARFKSEFYINYNAKMDWEELTAGEQEKTHIYTEDGTPAWTTFNIRSSYQINDNIQINAGIENLMDIHYRPYSSGISAPGRNFILTVRGNF